MKRKTISEEVDDLLREKCARELALGYARYEELRKLTVRQFADLHHRNLRGESFDSMVDKLYEQA